MKLIKIIALILFLGVATPVVSAQDDCIDFIPAIESEESQIETKPAKALPAFEPLILNSGEVVFKQGTTRVDVIDPLSSAYYPGGRGANKLVIYTPSYGLHTGTNEFGTEAVVVDNIVTSLSGADSAIPENGIVISGHGTAKNWISRHITVGSKVFVDMMNSRAQELGMTNTVFKNCHGIDEDGHLTSSHDIALMSRELITNHPKITEYTTIWMDNLRNGQSELVNTNKLIRNYEGATGLKTGSTSSALFNLSASATRNNLSLIAVIMRGETSAIRFAEAQKLLDYGFSNFEYVECAKKDDIVKTINVDKGITSSVDAIFELDAGCLIKKGTSKNITSIISLDDNISAPITKGQKLGEVTYSINEETIAKVNIIAKEDVKKLNLINMCTRTIENWFTLLR